MENKNGDNNVNRKCAIGILSLGCPRNIVDSESILGRLFNKGYKITDMEKAEVAIVNTCAFIDDAKRESVDAILDLIDLKNKGRLKKIIIYGCLSQRYKNQLRKELPEVDAFIGTISLNHENNRFPIISSHYAYLKICEGCINNCSYCVIPRIKQGFSSLDIDSILGKVDSFNKSKIAELNIIGQDITGYGIDLCGTSKLTFALRQIIERAKDIVWIRLLYLYPSRITDELIDLIKDQSKLCKYIDVPIQHISARILKLMGRQTRKKDILKLIDKIRGKIPDLAMRTSVIVGFPSETDREFRELLDFIREAKFERLGAFIYSREEGTAAYDYKKQIPRRIKLERFNNLMLEQQRVSQEVNKRFLGRIIDVLIDEKENGQYLGRSQYDAPEVDGTVYVSSKKELKAGDFIKVKITDTLEYDLTGEAI